MHSARYVGLLEGEGKWRAVLWTVRKFHEWARSLRSSPRNVTPLRHTGAAQEIGPRYQAAPACLCAFSISIQNQECCLHDTARIEWSSGVHDLVESTIGSDRIYSLLAVTTSVPQGSNHGWLSPACWPSFVRITRQIMHPSGVQTIMYFQTTMHVQTKTYNTFRLWYIYPDCIQTVMYLDTDIFSDYDVHSYNQIIHFQTKPMIGFLHLSVLQ